MFKGLKKDPKTGVVLWNSKLCVGCRYCEIACPYHVPKFQWEGYNPKIVKCELCKERLAKGEQPACSSVSPSVTRAVPGVVTAVLGELARAGVSYSKRNLETEPTVACRPVFEPAAR